MSNSRLATFASSPTSFSSFHVSNVLSLAEIITHKYVVLIRIFYLIACNGVYLGPRFNK